MSDLTQILNNAESYRKSKDIDFSSLRTGYRTYEIEISHDDEGYYFDIYQIDHVEGDSFSVREYRHDAHIDSPFKTREQAIEAGKAWIRNNP